MEIQLIQTAQQLESCIDQLKHSKRLSIDLEFDKNRFRYGFQLCLMQIAAEEGCFVIDPLAGDVEIKRLFPILESDSSEKVVFAFGEDIRLLHTLGCFPKGLYDLRTATSLLNFPPASLTNLLDEIMGIQVGKSAQNSNWFLRPLTQQQIEYAADDVRYLSQLKEWVEEAAREKGILSWIQEENEFLDNQDFAETSNNELFRTKDKMGHSEYSWYVLEALLNFRENLAKEINRPSYQIFHKDFLNELSQDPDAINKWDATRGIHRSMKNDHIKRQLKAVVLEAHQAAHEKKLSESNLEVPRLSPEELRERRRESTRVENIKQSVFVPIKQRIIKDYGENAATFMLSNRAIMEILSGNKSLLRNYKRDLLLKYGRELSLEVEEYL